MKKFIIKSLGCKQNQLEGQIIKEQLLNSGYIYCDEIESSDIYILNSCTVTSHTDSQVNYLLSHSKKINPNIKNILVGCLVQTGNFKNENVDLALGNTEKMNIRDYIEKSGIFSCDIFKINEFQNKFLSSSFKTRMNIKIQDGCNNRCSYCIIPYARGNSRSNSIENIIKQINKAIELNVKEIVITGIHIGQWGFEFNLKLIDLLKEIEKTDIPRYRLGSLYVNEIDDELIDFLKNSNKFCPHFHLSLQSMCDKTLKNMNRFYSVDDEIRLIEKLHLNFKLPYIGCDIIAGFPYEDESDFEITYNNIKKSKLSSIHCFPYSRRKNTPAYDMPQVKDSSKTVRVKKLMDLSKMLHNEFLEKNKNENAEILIQKRSLKTQQYSALTRNYIKLNYASENDNLKGTLLNVNLSDFELF